MSSKPSYSSDRENIESEARENFELFAEDSNSESDNKIITIELFITIFCLAVLFYFGGPKISETIQEAGNYSGQDLLLIE